MPVRRRRTTRLMLTILGTALVLIATAATAQAAPFAGPFQIVNFAVVPSTVITPANPSVTTSFERNGATNERIRRVRVRWPAGLDIVPASLPTQCTTAQFTAFVCPASSKVGVATATSYAIATLTPSTWFGDIFHIANPSSANPTLGITLVSGGQPTVNLTDELVFAGGTWRHRLFAPFQLPWPPNWVPTSRLLQNLSFTLQGVLSGGPFIVNNTTACAPATSQIRARSSLGAIVTATDSFTSFPAGGGVPDTCITAGPPPIAPPIGTFDFESSAVGATFECSVDGGLFAACTSPFTYGPLPAGIHTFCVRSIDTFAAVDPSPACQTFSI